jgi:hypothetical protein
MTKLIKVIKSTISAIVALIGVIGGSIWSVLSGWEMEAIVLTTVSFFQILGYVVLRSLGAEDAQQQIDDKIKPVETAPAGKQSISVANLNEKDRQTIIDAMKSKLKVLFIDDDKNFNVVKILKDSGWRHVKTVVDIKHLDIPTVSEAEIFFVDINGVGKLLNLANEGLDLALMLKQKYSSKKVVIYSANKNSNSFHKAWDECDFKLEKNALPYQFQSLVEQFSIEIHNSK